MDKNKYVLLIYSLTVYEKKTSAGGYFLNIMNDKSQAISHIIDVLDYNIGLDEFIFKNKKLDKFMENYSRLKKLEHNAKDEDIESLSYNYYNRKLFRVISAGYGSQGIIKALEYLKENLEFDDEDSYNSGNFESDDFENKSLRQQIDDLLNRSSNLNEAFLRDIDILSEQLFHC